MGKNKNAGGYLALCYHYIRPPKNLDLFPRVLGNSIKDLHQHIRMLQKNYEMMSLEDAYHFSYGSWYPKHTYGILMSFDDGLSDHYEAARILTKYGIRAAFFIPTCIISDGLPANPTIMHYSLAGYGIEQVLVVYREALLKYDVDFEKYNIIFRRGKDNPWIIIEKIKSMFRHRFEHGIARKIMLYIYDNLMHRDYPNALDIMHLTREQIKEILAMGHSVGPHSHTHISVARSELLQEDFEKEIVAPKRYIEDIFDTKVYAFSYPFGWARDCLRGGVVAQTKEYKLAFTAIEFINTKETSPYSLGRFISTSKDTAPILKEKLSKIFYENRRFHK